MILPWDLPTVPGISQKIPPHTSKIKQTWLNQIHSITEIWLYSAILSSNGFLFSSTIMVLNYYFAQHLKKICTYTKGMSREKLDYKSISGIRPGLSTYQCISSNGIPLNFFWNANLSNLTYLSNLSNFHKPSKPNNYKDFKLDRRRALTKLNWGTLKRISLVSKKPKAKGNLLGWWKCFVSWLQWQLHDYILLPKPKMLNLKWWILFM